MRRVAAMLFGLAAVAGTARGAAEFWVVAFGDSITEGCCDRPFPDGGYPQRLAELWDCVYFQAPFPPPDVGTPVPCPVSVPYPACAVVNPPGNCAIANRGKSGEQAIMEGVTRLQNVVLREWTWDVVVLMEGTNDIGLGLQSPPYSTATIKTALETMDAAAADEGVDVVHAPIVEYHPYALNYTPICQGVPGYNPRPWLEPARADLRTEVIDIATTRNRYLSDQSERLCPNVGNDSPHGHTRSECLLSYDYGEKCGIGHPSGSRDNPALGGVAWQYDGYNNMAEGFFNDLTALPLPGAVTPTAPSGGVCGAPTSFDWTKESNETATWYRVEIDGTAYDEWHQEWDWRPAEEDLCQPDADPDDDCSLLNPLSLGEGSHTWRVRGRNPGGLGPWSAPVNFDLAVTTPPAVDDLQSPTGDILTGAPPYRWGEKSGASDYRLLIQKGASTVFDQTYDSSICAGGVCQATSVPSLADDDYTWRVQSSNGACLAAWSGTAAFSIYTSAPATPLTTYPTGVTFETSPTYYWGPAERATEYDLEVRIDDTNWVADPANPHSAAGCASECSATPSLPLTPGGRGFRVAARNPFGTGSKGTELFTVLNCAMYSPDPPPFQNETVIMSRTEYSCSKLTAGNLGLGDFVIQGSSTVLEFFAGSVIEIHGGFRVETGATFIAGTDR